eukprot:gene19809-22515_t
MSERRAPPASVTTTRGSRARPLHFDQHDKEDSGSDFDEFGSYDRQSEREPVNEAAEVIPPVKQNRTRLGKLLASVSLISPKKKPAASSERESFSTSSSSSSSTKAPSSSLLRHTLSSSKAPVMSRPVSMPLSRSAAAPATVPVITRTSSKAPARITPQDTEAITSTANPASSRMSMPHQSQAAAFTKPRGSRDSRENSTEQEPLKPVRRSSRQSSGENEQITSPSAVAHSLSARLRSDVATASVDSVLPVLSVVQPNTTHSASIAPAQAQLTEHSAKLDKEYDFPTPPSHTIDVTPRRSAVRSVRIAVTPDPSPVRETRGSLDEPNKSRSAIAAGESDRPSASTLPTPEEESVSNQPSEGQYSEYFVTPTESTAAQINAHVPVTAVPVRVDPQPLALLRYMRILVRFSPEPLSSFFARLEPTVHRWATTLHFLLLTMYIFFEIALELAIELYVWLKPYKPELLLPSFAGLIMCFFGGSFVTTIAAAEAYRLVGYDSTMECVRSLMEDFQKVLIVAERDAALGIDDIEPTLDTSDTLTNTNTSSKEGNDDVWSDVRFETESVKFTRAVENNTVEARTYYSDGSEFLLEQHPGTDTVIHSHKIGMPLTPHRNKTGMGFSDTSPDRAEHANTSSSASKTTTTPSTSNSSGVKTRKRRSMFSAHHSNELDSFRTTVLEQYTPIKKRGGCSSILSPLRGAALSPLQVDPATESTDNTLNDTNNIVPMEDHHAQTLQEYQKEQEEFGADTTASRALFFLQNVDPQRFSTAIVGLNAGLVAVVATLKVQFAMTVTLGASLSKVIGGPAKVFLLPLVELALPKPYKRWADVILTYTVRSFAISIAWTLRRVVSSYHSAIRGGLMFSKNLLGYLVDMGYIKKDSEYEAYLPYVDKIVGYAIAVLGLWFQLTYGFSLPFPLN